MLIKEAAAGLAADWAALLEEEFDKPYFVNLMERLDEEYRSFQIYPSRTDMFNALKYTPFEQVKAVILGQVI